MVMQLKRVKHSREMLPKTSTSFKKIKNNSLSSLTPTDLEVPKRKFLHKEVRLHPPITIFRSMSILEVKNVPSQHP